MAHVFRALWVDDHIAASSVIQENFKGWLDGRGSPVEMVRDRSVFVSDRSVTWTTLERDGGIAEQFFLRQRFPEAEGEGHWLTSVTLLEIDSHNIIVVDVHAEGHHLWHGEVKVPRLVKNLLLAGGDPKIGPDRIEVQPREVDDQHSLTEMIDGLRNQEREIPYVIVHVGDSVEGRLLKQYATRCSETLAGLAQVFSVDDETLPYLNGILGPEIEVGEHGARLMMPGVMDQRAEARLSYHVSLDELDDNPKSLGRAILRRIASTSQWNPIDAQSRQLKKAVDEERRRIMKAASIDPTNGMARVLDDEESVSLRARIDKLQDELLTAVIAAEEAQEDRNLALNQLTSYLMNGESVEELLPDRLDIESVIAAAREHLDHVVVPLSAPRMISKLDQLQAKTWARDLSLMFQAMERFALASSTGKFNGDFREWCKQRGGFPYGKVAMTESETTAHGGHTKGTRVFGCDLALDPSGSIQMLAHVKIQAKGNDTSPRVFFYDDTKGRTGKVHIGFIGPHALVPTASF